MSYLDPTTRASLNAQLTAINGQLTAANAAYLAALENSEISTYRFESGEGTNQVTRRDPASIFNQILLLESRKRRIESRLSGTGIVNLNLRRRL
jgi:hypothetical protein